MHIDRNVPQAYDLVQDRYLVLVLKQTWRRKRGMKARGLLWLLLSLTIILSLIFGLGSVAAAAPPEGKGPPINVVVVVHYPHQADRVFSGVEGEAQLEQVSYIDSGLRWKNPDAVKYYTNLGKKYTSFLGGIRASFDTWNDAKSGFKATYGG